MTELINFLTKSKIMTDINKAENGEKKQDLRNLLNLTNNPDFNRSSEIIRTKQTWKISKNNLDLICYQNIE